MYNLKMAIIKRRNM